MSNNFYTNILTCSLKNIMAVSLYRRNLYLYDCTKYKLYGKNKVFENHILSLSWNKNGVKTMCWDGLYNIWNRSIDCDNGKFKKRICR